VAWLAVCWHCSSRLGFPERCSWEAVLRLCTAYLKLLFAHVTEPDGIDKGEFKRYCLRPAVQMRAVIRQQLQTIDPLKYGGKNVAAYTLREVDQ
jgi:ATP-dependent Lon protease